MTIRDFHVRLFAGAKESALLEALKRLTALEDPRLMASEEVTTGWIIWQDLAAQEVAAAC